MTPEAKLDNIRDQLVPIHSGTRLRIVDKVVISANFGSISSISVLKKLVDFLYERPDLLGVSLDEYGLEAFFAVEGGQD